MSRTSSSPEDLLDVTELIASLAAERDGLPRPSHRPDPPRARHRLQVEPGSRHRLQVEPEEVGARRRRVVRLAAPALVAVLVLAVLAVASSLRSAADPAPTDAALTGAAPAASTPTATSSPTPTAALVPPTSVEASSSAASSSSGPASATASRTAAKRAPSTAVAPRATVAADSGAAGVRPVRPACRGNAASPKPGDVICFTGDRDAPLKISTGGTASAPIVYSGNGRTRVPGITSTADNVVIQGFVSDGADSTGIWASGRNVVVQDNTVTNVRHTDEDLDAIRFFGDGFKVLHNFVHDLEGSSDIGGSHVDCIQTYATSRPGSSDVTIQGNRCEGIRAQCLMAEGPNDDGGSGEGVSRNWLFDGNYCDAHAAAQSVALEDIQNVTISRNVMAGKATKAFALGRDSTGTVVKGNTIGAGYGREVGFDDESARKGYQGPEAR